MNYDIQICELGQQDTAVVRYRATLAELASVVPRGCGEVWAFIRSRGLAHPGRNIALYLDDEMNIEVGIEVYESFDGNDNVIASHLPAGRVITTTHIGPYDLLGEAHGALHEYCHAKGLVPAGPNWEIYGHQAGNSDAPRTDVFVLLA